MAWEGKSPDPSTRLTDPPPTMEDHLDKATFTMTTSLRKEGSYKGMMLDTTTRDPMRESTTEEVSDNQWEEEATVATAWDLEASRNPDSMMAGMDSDPTTSIRVVRCINPRSKRLWELHPDLMRRRIPSPPSLNESTTPNM
jgi:hypothetical protein